jgi:hypothetical protein
VIGFLLVTAYCALITTLLVALTQLRRARRLDRHIEEALALTADGLADARPLGPEDYPEWSDPR